MPRGQRTLSQVTDSAFPGASSGPRVSSEVPMSTVKKREPQLQGCRAGGVTPEHIPRGVFGSGSRGTSPEVSSSQEVRGMEALKAFLQEEGKSQKEIPKQTPLPETDGRKGGRGPNAGRCLQSQRRPGLRRVWANGAPMGTALPPASGAALVSWCPR